MNAQQRQPRSGLGFWLFVMAFVVAMAMIGDVGHVIIHREIPLQMGFKPDANATVVVAGLQASVHGWTTVAVPLGSLGAPAITFLITTGSLSLWLGIRFGAITRATAEAPLGAQRTPHPTTREETER